MDPLINVWPRHNLVVLLGGSLARGLRRFTSTCSSQLQGPAAEQAARFLGIGFDLNFVTLSD